MASSFIYRPHVATLDGVITPDVLIDSLMIAKKGEAKPLPVPIDRMTMDIEMQVAGPGAAPDAALALIGAGMDREALIAKLDGCLMTEAEMEQGPEGWRELDDPFPEWPQPDGT